MNTSTAVRTKLALARPALQVASAPLWRTSGLRQRFPAYLRTLHAVIRASVPLMRMAARRSEELGAKELHAYLIEHIDEERDHDVWLLEDLAVLDEGPVDVPPPAVARMVGAQYYWIAHHHPVALMGYIAVLEGNAPAGWFADWVIAATGLPEAAVRTVRLHADLDRAHIDEVYDLLDRLDLSPAQQAFVTVSGLSTMDSLIELFGAIAVREG